MPSQFLTSFTTPSFESLFILPKLPGLIFIMLFIELQSMYHEQKRNTGMPFFPWCVILKALKTFDLNSSLKHQRVFFDPHTAKSSSGYIEFYIGYLIIYSSKVQLQLALSTAEAECIVFSMSLHNVIPIM
ncbi:hypothetical protein ACHAW6_000688 [Cyclotella cf. meneghiniana]